MKKLLHKSYVWLVALVAMFAMSTSAWAQDATIMCSNGSTSGEGVSITGGDYYGGFGIMAGNITISAGTNNIDKIVITDNPDFVVNKLTSNPSGVTNGSIHTWTAGDANVTSVSFSTSSTWFLSKVEVWFKAATTPEEPEPSDTPEEDGISATFDFTNSVPASQDGILCETTGGWYSNQKSLRLGSKKSVTFTAPKNFEIVSIVLEDKTTEFYRLDQLVSDQPTLTCSNNNTVATWTGKASSVTFTNNSTYTSVYSYIRTATVKIAPIVVEGPAMQFNGDGKEYEKALTTVSSSSEYGLTYSGIDIYRSGETIWEAIFTSGRPMAKIVLTGLEQMNKLTASTGTWNPNTGVWIGNAKTVRFYATETYDDYIETAQISYAPVEEESATAKGEHTNGKFYGTFYSDYDWVVPAGCTAYAVTDVTDGKMTLTVLAEEGESVANEHAVILESDSEIDSPANAVVATTLGAKNANNMLGGVLETQYVGGDGAKYYALSKKDGKLGFYWDPETYNDGASVHCPAHKAYLRVPSGGSGDSNGLSFRFDDLLTAISNANFEKGESAIYNLQGQRVNNAPKAGVYVKNGRKFIVK